MKDKRMTIEEILHLHIEGFVESIPEHNARIDFLKEELDAAIKNKDNHLVFLLNNELMQQRATIDKCKTLTAFCNKLLEYIEESNEQ